LPPFAEIRVEHFAEALPLVMAAHQADIRAIGEQTSVPTFENTVLALEASGSELIAVHSVFSNLTSAHTSEALQKIEAEFAPKIALHQSAVYLNEKLFARMAFLYERRQDLGLDGESQRLLERLYTDFVRAGARLQGEARARYEQLVGELAELQTAFSQNLQKAMAATRLVINDAKDLAGLPASLVEEARVLAESLGQKGAWAFQLNEPTVLTFVTFSERREWRERFWKMWKKRGEAEGEWDNRLLIARILQARREQAALLGFSDFSKYALADTMAGRPEAAHDLLKKVWEPAREAARLDRQELTRVAELETGGPFELQEWDWHHYAEKVRKARFDLNEAEVSAYFSAPRMRAAAFEVASRLFGIGFRELSEAPKYHPDVQVWEVFDLKQKDPAQAHVGVLLTDDYARPSKRSGAWMSNYREQSALHGKDVRPVIVNVCNFPAPTQTAASKEPSLLSQDEVRTLFHELGHGLHGLLSRCRFPRLSGTNVLRDFVEFPSQVLEHWAREPELLKKHARHYQTGEPLPAALLEKMQAAGRFNQAYLTVEYTASALADLALHQLPELAQFDPTRFEADFLKQLRMPEGIPLRHRLPHFLHSFSSDFYASKYYVYLWAGVLDADGYGAFEEAGSPYAPEPASRLLKHVYSAGDSQDPMQAYVAFRGRPPEVTPLLRLRGLLSESAELR
jgi:peptidyl-dipeptidase Dcp